MKTVRLTKIFHFETSHALHGYDGKCKNIHGHSYGFHVTVAGEAIEEEGHVKNGMLIDFGDLKKIVNDLIIDVFDHALVLNGNSPHKNLGEDLIKQGHKIILLPFQPTCENLLTHFVELLSEALPKTVKLVALKLIETETSYAEWLALDQ